MEKIAKVVLTGFAILVCLSMFGCQTKGAKKTIKTATEICTEVRIHQNLVRVGTDIALQSAKALEAKLIIYDTLDSLILVCGLLDAVAEQHDIERPPNP